MLALAAAACADIPRDPDGTLERVHAERSFRVGYVASSGAGHEAARAFLRRVADAASARPEIETGASEPLLARLAEGELDLVLGPFAPGTPWGKHVTLLAPFDEQVGRDGQVHYRAAARNGENAWIALLHRESRAVRAAAP